jgi:hypothetical protein
MPGSRPYRIGSRALSRLEEGLAVFVQERTPAVDQPELPGPLAWLGAAAMLLSLVLLPSPPAARKPVGTLPLVLLVLWGVGASVRIGAWLKRRKAWKRAAASEALGWFAVRFEGGSGRARIVGPAAREAASEATGPEAGSLPLARVDLKEWMSPDHPWSDAVGPDDYTALNLAFRVGDAGPDWEGNFDLLEGVEPDFRWYVTMDNPEAVRRRGLARGLLGRPAEPPDAPSNTGR